MKWFLAVFCAISVVFLTIFGINCVYSYLYPMKFQDEITAACQQFDMPQAVVFSVINVESRFDKNAVSSKGAVGLMQLMPTTAQDLTDKDFDLKNPSDNIMLGTKYLSILTTKFGDLHTALAAYNAGPSVVKEWLKDPNLSRDGKTLEKIPYEQTRGYIKKFDKNFKHYTKKLS